MVVLRMADNEEGDGYHEGFEEHQFLAKLFKTENKNIIVQMNPVETNFVDPELLAEYNLMTYQDVPRFDPETLVVENQAYIYYNILSDKGNFNINRCTFKIL